MPMLTCLIRFGHIIYKFFTLIYSGSHAFYVALMFYISSTFCSSKDNDAKLKEDFKNSNWSQKCRDVFMRFICIPSHNFRSLIQSENVSKSVQNVE